MALSFSLVPEVPDSTCPLGVGVFSDRMSGEDGLVDWAFLAERGFEGKIGESLAMPGEGGRTVVALGLGDASKLSVKAIRTAAANLSRAAAKSTTVATCLLEAAATAEFDLGDAAQAIAEGLTLASYRFDRLKSKPGSKPALEEAVIIGSGDGLVARLERGSIIAGAVMLARDLVNEPGGSLTPRAFADKAVEVGSRAGVTVSVLDEVDIEAARLGGLLGVNRGSTEPPRFVELTYDPEGATSTLALVGKGITFDSGGLSIKTFEGMKTMKCDMAGAAAVLAAMSALPALGVTTRVRGYLPLTDNMTGGDATRPGDVLKIRNGKTVEVLNTDAEGRLILADGLSVAAEAEPDAIVDIATLTGACMVALGRDVAGVMSNDDGFRAKVLDASERAGESMWPLPLPAEYRKGLDSAVADMANISGVPYGGALTAGLFLSEFVPADIPWAHLDIAGPAFTDTDAGESTKGGTGYAVRSLIALAEAFGD